MIERVARAMVREWFGSAAAGNRFTTHEITAARAAISAMREPTEAMLAAARVARNEDARELRMKGQVAGAERRNTVTWQAMIDEALKP